MLLCGIHVGGLHRADALEAVLGTVNHGHG